MSDTPYEFLLTSMRALGPLFSSMLDPTDPPDLSQSYLTHAVETHRLQWRDLIFAFAGYVTQPLNTAYRIDDFIVMVERTRGNGWKAYIVNDPMRVINEHLFKPRHIKPFYTFTANGLNYMEVSTDDVGTKLFIIRYDRPYVVDTTLDGDALRDYGMSYYNIMDVFNAIQMGSMSQDGQDIQPLSKATVMNDKGSKIIPSVIRASRYMLTHGFQTTNVSDSVYLNPLDPQDDQLTLHRRLASYYTLTHPDSDHIQSNFRSKLTIKDRVAGQYRTVCTAISADFTVSRIKQRPLDITQLRRISVQTSVGHAVDIRI